MSFTTDQVSQIIYSYVTERKSRNQIAREVGIADKYGTDGCGHILRVLKTSGIEIRGQKEAGRISRAATDLQIRTQVEQTLGKPLSTLCTELSCIEMSTLSGVRYTTLRQFLIKNNLTPLKTSQKAQQIRKGRKRVNDDELVELYVNQRLTMKQVAAHFNITPGAVCLHCQRLGISRTTAEAYQVMVAQLTDAEKQERHVKRSEISSAMVANSARKYSHTDIEMLFMEWCDKREFEYIHQYKIKGIRHIYDFLLPTANTIVEVDGDYWHAKPEQAAKDKAYQFLVETRGYKAIRFLRSEIKSSKSACFDRLLPLLCL